MVRSTHAKAQGPPHQYHRRCRYKDAEIASRLQRREHTIKVERHLRSAAWRHLSAINRGNRTLPTGSHRGPSGYAKFLDAPRPPSTNGTSKSRRGPPAASIQILSTSEGHPNKSTRCRNAGLEALPGGAPETSQLRRSPDGYVSSIISLPKSAGEPTSGSSPRSASWALILGSASPALISLLSLSMMSGGVFFGAAKPPHVLTA